MTDHSPTIVNNTRHTIVVFCERGILFNQVVLHPNEAVSLTRKQTGGFPLVRYKVHAVIGDENSLPTTKDSMKNLLKCSAIPAAFVTGALVTAVGAGMLVGPSAALAPLVTGMVVNGVVVDSAAIAAGGLLATRAQAITDMLLKDQPDKFMSKTGNLRPGMRYLIVKGGLSDGPVTIEDTTKRKFDNLTIAAWKEPIAKKNNDNQSNSSSSSRMLQSDENMIITTTTNKEEIEIEYDNNNPTVEAKCY